MKGTSVIFYAAEVVMNTTKIEQAFQISAFFCLLTELQNYRSVCAKNLQLCFS